MQHGIVVMCGRINIRNKAVNIKIESANELHVCSVHAACSMLHIAHIFEFIDTTETFLCLIFFIALDLAVRECAKLCRKSQQQQN